jgi:hypothetical protein
MSAQSLVFDDALRRIAVPALAARGFAYDASRTFRRVSADGKHVDLINFQLGQRSFAGKFTVNLGVFRADDNPGIDVRKAKEYHCPISRRIRIGLVVPSRMPGLASVPVVGFLFGGQDRWWRFSTDAARTGLEMQRVVGLVIEHGLAWHASMRHA